MLTFFTITLLFELVHTAKDTKSMGNSTQSLLADHHFSAFSKRTTNLKKINLIMSQENPDDEENEEGDSEKDWLIVGGEKAYIGQFPYQARLNYYDPDSRATTNCGGSLISDSYVLSAAHCVVDKSEQVRMIENFRVTVGTSSYGSGGNTVSVTKIFVHPGFSRSPSLKRDLAVLKTTYRFELSDTVAPAALPRREMTEELEKMEEERQKCLVAGWGNIKYKGPAADALLYADLPLLPIAECVDMGKKFGFGVSRDFHLCTFIEEKDACSGDSGGGLLCDDAVEPRQEGEPAPVVMGVVSFGKGCANPEAAGYYARVDTALPFIELALAEGSSPPRPPDDTGSPPLRAQFKIVVFIHIVSVLVF